MEDKRMTGTIKWHLVEDEGNPENWGDYIVTTEKGTVRSVKWGYRWDAEKRENYRTWKVNKGVKVLAWAELPEPCQACPIEVIKARKEYELAKKNFEKALEKYNATSKEKI